MRSSKKYQNLGGLQTGRDSVPWYWRLIALTSSWMILGGYLIISALYDKDPKLKFSKGVLTVFVVALMTAGYSFTALLCFACRNEMFQAEAIFLPALTSSSLGLLTVCYNFATSERYEWGTAAIITTVLAIATSLIYGILLIWTHHRILKIKERTNTRSNNLWSEQSFYQNYLANMYPATRMGGAGGTYIAPTGEAINLTEDDRINHQMALLLMNKSDPKPSPDASQSTFRIDLPEDREERERWANSSELLGTPSMAHHDWGRSRSDPLNTSAHTDQRGAGVAWESRGRTDVRPSVSQSMGGHSRAISREERRREIELGRYPSHQSANYG